MVWLGFHGVLHFLWVMFAEIKTCKVIFYVLFDIVIDICPIN